MPRKKTEPEWTNPLPLMPRREPLTKQSKNEWIDAQRRAGREVPPEIENLSARIAYKRSDEEFEVLTKELDRFEHKTIYNQIAYEYFYKKGELQAWINPLGEKMAYA